MSEHSAVLVLDGLAISLVIAAVHAQRRSARSSERCRLPDICHLAKMVRQAHRED